MLQVAGNTIPRIRQFQLQASDIHLRLGGLRAYAGPGTWFDYALGRKPALRYAVVPHEGNWEKAMLWQEMERWSEPLVVGDDAPANDPSFSFARSLNPHVHLTSLYQDRSATFLRLFNASASPAEAPLTISAAISRAEVVELDGRASSELTLQKSDDDQRQFALALPPFAVRTIRLHRT